MKLYISSMSRAKKDIQAFLDEHTDICILHLIKLYLYRDNVSSKHWRKGVAETLNRVSKLKGSNKFPSAKFIYTCTWLQNNDRIPYFLQGILRDYGDPDISYTYDKLYDSLESYFKWISNSLSKHGTVFYSDIYDKLDELGF